MDILKQNFFELFNIDISRENENLRLIIRKIQDLQKSFYESKKVFNIYLQSKFDKNILKTFIKENNEKNHSLFIYLNKDKKLLSFDFSQNYQISSFNHLDQLVESKTLDYSIDLL